MKGILWIGGGEFNMVDVLFFNPVANVIRFVRQYFIFAKTENTVIGFWLSDYCFSVTPHRVCPGRLIIYGLFSKGENDG